MKMRFTLLTFLALTSWSFVHCQTHESSNLTNFRLPTNVYPTNYNLFITTFLPGYEWKADDRNLTFQGDVVIDIIVKEPTDKITLHAVSLEILYAEVTTDVPQNVSKWDFTPEFQFLNLYLDEEIQAGTVATISIGFNGRLRNDLNGYYITHSRTTSGDTKINAVTQFEPANARKMVPCFDEPEFKATWDVYLQHPSGSTALSNGIATASYFYDDFTVTQFATSQKMSSYLLAIFVGDVSYKQTRTDRDIRMRVYADPVDYPYVDHALNVSRITVEGFENLFGIEYPMKKVDFVAARNFAAGAMENWGLIVHSRGAILGESDYVSEVVIHELAHQWFGNLVTMKFWGQVWLNEGFATYVTPFALQFLDPRYDRDFYYVEHQLWAQKNGDGELPLNTIMLAGDEYEISQNNYSKGSSFIRMLEKIIGTENFLDAIRRYLSQNSYSNTDVHDLYKSLEPFYSKTEDAPELEEFARCWTNQNGYPTVYVEYSNGKLRLTQKKDAKIQPLFTRYNECDYKWDIPIWYQEAGNVDIKLVWFTRDREFLELNIPGAVIVNANSNGYYTVVYSDDLYEMMAEELNNNRQIYSDSTKKRILFDIFNQVSNNQTSIHSLVKIAESLVDSENFEILNLLKNLLLHAKKFMDDRNEINMSDLEIIKNRVEELSGKIVFKECESFENFSSCYKKTFITNSHACDSMSLVGKGSDLDRLIKWLKHDSGSREIILKMLKCGDEETFLNVVNDTSYNWSLFEKELIEKLSESIKKQLNQEKEQKLVKYGKFLYSKKFQHFSSTNFA